MERLVAFIAGAKHIMKSYIREEFPGTTHVTIIVIVTAISTLFDYECGREYVIVKLTQRIDEERGWKGIYRWPSCVGAAMTIWTDHTT